MELNFLPDSVRSHLTITGRPQGTLSSKKLIFASVATTGVAITCFGLLACVCGTILGYQITTNVKICILIVGTLTTLASMVKLNLDRARDARLYVAIHNPI